MRFGSRLGPISNQFWNQFGVPKLLQKLSKKCVLWDPFLEPFFGGLEAHQVPLGSLLEPLMLILGSLWTPKPQKNNGFSMFFQIQLFGSLKLSMAILDPSWLLIGPIWSENGPDNDPKKYPKVVQKMVQKTAPKMLNSKMILGSNLKQFSGQIASKTQQSISSQHFRFSFRFHKTA